VNNDGTFEEPRVDIVDVVYLINYLFVNGPPPVHLDWPNHPPRANAGSDLSSAVEHLLYFDGRGSYDLDGTIVSYIWDFGDNTTGEGITTTHQYATNETFTVTLTVTDNESGATSDVALVTIGDGLVAYVHGSYNGIACQPVQFTGAATGGSQPYYWYWDFGDGADSTQQNPSHIYCDSGNYRIILTVIDSLDIISNDVTAVHIDPSPPLEADAHGPYTGTTCTQIQFTGSATGGCPLYTWYWDFGDGTTADTQNPKHTYCSPGNYTVTLTVNDTLRVVDDDTASVHIDPPPPLEADAHGPYNGTACQQIQFTGSATGGCPLYTWYWDFGDGTNSTQQNLKHTYCSPGNYTVTLTVNDTLGVVDDDTASVHIDPPPPLEADAHGPYSGAVCWQIQFTGSATGGCPLYTWYWDFGDGTTADTQNPKHTYCSPGNYTVTLTVNDTLGVVDDDTASVRIDPFSSLEADAHGPYTGNPYICVDFTGSATGGCAPYTWYWDFGDGGNSIKQNPQHAYIDEGNYTASLTVTDNIGAIHSDSAWVNITSQTTPP
jgi:PKD repeat protein